METRKTEIGAIYMCEYLVLRNFFKLIREEKIRSLIRKFYAVKITTKRGYKFLVYFPT